MTNKTILLLTTILFLSSCSVKKKFIKLLDSGSIPQKTFKAEIPFEYKFGLVLIKVELNKEVYDFVLDSGAPNVISKELAKTLGRKELITINAPDAQGNAQAMGITKIEGMTIGGIKFEETCAAIGDFNQSVELGCLDIDGLIGANLMSLAVWKIDYRNQIITISDSKENIAVDASAKRIPFFTDDVNTPYCNIKINDQEEKNVMIDLGASGGFSLSSRTYDQIQESVPNNKKVMQFGYTGFGFFGYGKMDSSYYLQVNELSFGEIKLNKQVLKFSKNSTPRMGTAFFKNYDLVMNWKDQELLLSPHADFENQSFTHFGITFHYKDESLRIASLLKDSEAEKLGIQLGDKIMGINDNNYKDLSEEDYCNLVEHRNWDKEVWNIVLSRAGQEMSFQLKNSLIIE